MAPLIPTVRISGGNPAGMPDYKPLNPWGRAMPKPVRAPRAPLYQLIVRRKGVQMPYSPKLHREFLEPLLEAINTAIRLGVEKEMTDPHIVLCV